MYVHVYINIKIYVCVYIYSSQIYNMQNMLNIKHICTQHSKGHMNYGKEDLKSG